MTHGVQVVVADRDELVQRAAREVESVLAADSPVLGVATGSTPEAVYATLAARGVDAGSATAFALDEYVGLADGDERSYEATLWRLLGRPLGLGEDRLHVPSARGDGPAEYERRIRAAGGVDLQLLGIGTNGHIGFNEPGSSFDTRTRVVELAASTRRDNARFFADAAEVPRSAVTQGIATILDARRLVLLAFGSAKAPAVRRALTGPVGVDSPASALRQHRDVLVLLDHQAAAGLDQEAPAPRVSAGAGGPVSARSALAGQEPRCSASWLGGRPA